MSRIEPKLRRFALFTLPFASLLNLAPQASARPRVEITQAQAVSQVREIVDRNSGPCRITQVQSASRVKTGWRVVAQIKLSGTSEKAAWIVTNSGSIAAQNQLTAEIENGCP